MPEVAIDLIKPSPYQPRLDFDLEDLRGTIMKDGIASPLVVRQIDTDYELIDGQRRLMLAKDLGYKTVPCEVIEADDERAMRLVWRLNVARKDYTPKEKAYHFRDLLENYGMSLRTIARQRDSTAETVKAYLNVFKLPEEYQQMVWDRAIPVGVVQEIEKLFNGVMYMTPETKPEAFAILDRAWKEKHFTYKEAREAMKPYLAKLREEQVRKAQEAIGEVLPEITLETPEDYDRAGKALKEKAKRMRREAMTPEEILKEEEEKQRKKREKEEKKRQEELRRLEAETIETTKTKEDIEKAKAKLRELIPEGKRTELEEVLATSDLSLGVLEKLPDAIKREPDRPIIEIARELHLEATPGTKKPPARGPKPEPLLTDWVNEVTKAGYNLIEQLDTMMAGNFKQVAPRFEILRIEEMLFALEKKIRKYREAEKEEGGNDA